MKELPKPSEGELRILQVLWNRGPSTVRDVFERLGQTTGVGYTTILKLLQIMHEKGLVARDESARSHIYSARLSREEEQERSVENLLQTVFNGSKKQLVLQILADEKVSKKELTEIQSLISELVADSR